MRVVLFAMIAAGVALIGVGAAVDLPGALSVFTGGSAKLVCSGVFASGREPEAVIGDDLYRRSTDESERLQCQACHGATHATYPAHNTNFGADRDNIQPLQYQGMRRAIGAAASCEVCHTMEMEDSIHHPGMEEPAP